MNSTRELEWQTTLPSFDSSWTFLSTSYRCTSEFSLRLQSIAHADPDYTEISRVPSRYPLILTVMVCFPAASLSVAGEFPTKLPSNKTSAPEGFDVTQCKTT